MQPHWSTCVPIMTVLPSQWPNSLFLLARLLTLSLVGVSPHGSCWSFCALTSDTLAFFAPLAPQI